MLTKFRFSILCAFLICPFIEGMIDNRFVVPYLCHKPFLSYRDSWFHGVVQPFAMTTRRSYDEFEDKRGLFEINGNYNQVDIDNALILSGRTTESLFRSDLRGLFQSLPWAMGGRLEIYGVALQGYLALTDYFGLGASWAFMHVNSRLRLKRDTEVLGSLIVGAGDAREIFLTKEQMNKALGLTPGIYITNTPSDGELYARFAYVRDYICKLQHLDVALKLGVLVPTAKARAINNPASFSVGGDKHWGLYGEFTGDFILKQDLRAGFLINISKRLKRTACHRMPVCSEPINFGAVVGNAQVNPGITVGFSPYVTFECVRDGLGFRLAYTLVHHKNDQWSDRREVRDVPVNLTRVENLSEWSREYLTLGVLYDFAYDKQVRGSTPVVSLTWDIPVSGIITKRAFKTHGVSFIIESDF